MSLANEYTTVKLNSSVINYYENLGYNIPRIKKDYKWCVPINTTIEVKTNDLKEHSNVYVEAICDCCGKHTNIMYYKYTKNIKRNNGHYLCSTDKEHRDFNSEISIDKILESIKNFYNENNRFPKYNEYTIENGFKYSYALIIDRFKETGLSLYDELSKIDCFKLSNANALYYDKYIEKLREIIYEYPELGNNLYLITSNEKYRNLGVPTLKWFIEHCPDKTVTNVETFKEWMGLYSKHMPKEQCEEKIIEMARKYNRPLKYDDFRGHEYGQVTIQMIRNYWGSLNKMKQDLGLEINQESMIDKQLSKEDFNDTINQICEYVKYDNRNFITTREINKNKNWCNTGTLQKMSKKYYDCNLQDLLLKHNVTLGKQGNGICFDFEDGEHVTSQFEYMLSKFIRDYGLKYNTDYFRDVKYSSFIPEYKNNMNCDYVIHINNKIIYIEIAGILSEYKTWFYQDKSIQQSKSKEKYRTKLKQKEEMLKSNNLMYFILFPCDLTKENFVKILEDGSLALKKEIESFHQNNIDWVKIRNTNSELDYSKSFLRDTRRKKIV